VLNAAASHSVVGSVYEGWLAVSGQRLSSYIIRREGRRDLL